MKKRGILIVVLLVLSIFYGSMVLGAVNDTGTLSEDLEQYQAVQLIADCGSGIGETENCDEIEEHLYIYGSLDSIAKGNKERDSYCDARDNEELQKSWPDTGGGCYLIVEESDFVEDCGYTAVPKGINIDQSYKTLNERQTDLAAEYEYLGRILSSSAIGLGVGVAAFGAAYISGILYAASVTSTLGPVGWVISAVLVVSAAAAYVTDPFSDDTGLVLEETKFNFYDQKGVICGNEKKWVQCDEDHKDSLYWLTAKIEIEDVVPGKKLTKTVPT